MGYPFVCGMVIAVAVGIAVGRLTVDKAPDAPTVVVERRQKSEPIRKLHQERVESVVGRPSDEKIVADVLRALTESDWCDSVAMVESVGRLAALEDAQIRLAWQVLQARGPDADQRMRITALYVWSRMGRLEKGVRFPDAWRTALAGDALAVEEVRQNMAAIEARLRAGEAVGDVERRAFFGELIRRDSRAAFEMWCAVSDPMEHLGEINLFTGMFGDPAQRSWLIERLQAWPAAQRYVDDLVVGMAQGWIAADPRQAASWVETVAEPALRDRLRRQLGVTLATVSPDTAWTWCAALPGDQRLAVRAAGLGQLAGSDMDAGASLLATTVPGSDERRELLDVFASVSAMTDIGFWKSWRDTLPAAEQEQATTAGFTFWAQDDPVTASAWLRGRPADETRDRLATELVRVAAAAHPEAAAEWIGAIGDANQRMTAISLALGNLEPGDCESLRLILKSAASSL